MKQMDLNFQQPETAVQPRPNPWPRDPILYVEHNPQSHICPYCGRAFSDIVGCHKICRCGYMEGCGD